MKHIYSKTTFLLGLILILASCERTLSEDASFATFPNTNEIFTDTPIGMGSNFYFPYKGSKPTAWSVDTKTSYKGTTSMRFDVPNANDPEGNYAGAIFKIDGSGRDLTNFDALTFWAKASQGVTIKEIGFGEDFGANKYQVTRFNVPLSTTWQKYIIPIPDASKLVHEKGMLRYAASGIGAQGQEVGYTFWIDELKFEKLGTLAQPKPKILDGVMVSKNTFNGVTFQIVGTQTFNSASGQNITATVAPSYFTFKSSDPSIATVSELGKVSVLGSGKAAITGVLAGVTALGTLNIESIGKFSLPSVPTLPASNVISVFSNAYTNVSVDYFNGFWGGSTTKTADISTNGDDLKRYTQLNYVGIEFQKSTINAKAMTHLHLDIYTQETGTLTIRIRDRGSNGKIESDNNGNPIADDADVTMALSGISLMPNKWNAIEIPLNGRLANQKNNLSQIVFVGGITSFTVDNIYFHK